MALEVARALHLLDANDRLIPLDSLMVVELVIELEQRTKLKLRVEDVYTHMDSIAGIASLLDEVAKRESTR